ncbi:hypothetical protein BT69DRAFT_528218 [Atractiella rhizophila]|nr:hypothetical protein BT69DRAFT_528218 [Atractiella rhizophila]
MSSRTRTQTQLPPSPPHIVASRPIRSPLRPINPPPNNPRYAAPRSVIQSVQQIERPGSTPPRTMKADYRSLGSVAKSDGRPGSSDGYFAVGNTINRTSSPLKRAIGESADEGSGRSKRANSPHFSSFYGGHGQSVPYVDQPNLIRTSRPQQVSGSHAHAPLYPSGLGYGYGGEGYRRSSSAVSPHLHRNKSGHSSRKEQQERERTNKERRDTNDSESDDDFGDFRTLNVWRKPSANKKWQYQLDSDEEGDYEEEEGDETVSYDNMTRTKTLPVVPQAKKPLTPQKKSRSSPIVSASSVAISAKMTEIKAPGVPSTGIANKLSASPSRRSSSAHGRSLSFHSMNAAIALGGTGTDAKTSDFAVECQFSVEERGRSRDALRRLAQGAVSGSDSEPTFLVTPPRPSQSPMRMSREIQLRVPIPSSITATSSYSSPPLTPPHSSPGSYFASRTHLTKRHSPDSDRPSLHSYTSFEHDFNMKPPSSPSLEEADKKKGWWGR